MFSFTDTNVLTSAQLNGNFTEALDKTTGSAQSIVSAVTVNGGVTSPNVTVTALLTNTGAEVDNVTILTGTGNYVAVATDRYVVTNKTVAATTQITLPSSASVGRIIGVKDAKGDAGTNNVTVVPSGSDTIDGGSSLVINTNYGHASFLYVGSQWSLL